MASQGPKIVAAGASAAGGGVAWSNPGNITANDGVFATASLDNIGTDTTTNGLQGTMTSRAFTLPIGSTILGIQVDAFLKAISGLDSIIDNSILIIKGGTPGGTDHQRGSANQWVSAGSLVTFGGSSDLWGLSWTATDINATNFGIQISAKCLTTGGGPEVVGVDYAQLTVFFSPPGGVTVTGWKEW